MCQNYLHEVFVLFIVTAHNYLQQQIEVIKTSINPHKG